MRARKSTVLADALRDLVNELGISSRIREYGVVSAWPDVVGPHIAGVTEVRSIRNGILVIRVTHPAWRQELLLRKKELIHNLNVQLDGNIVRDIKLT